MMPEIRSSDAARPCPDRIARSATSHGWFLTSAVSVAETSLPTTIVRPAKAANDAITSLMSVSWNVTVIGACWDCCTCEKSAIGFALYDEAILAAAGSAAGGAASYCGSGCATDDSTWTTAFAAGLRRDDVDGARWLVASTLAKATGRGAVALGDAAKRLRDSDDGHAE